VATGKRLPPDLGGERIFQRIREESPDHRWFADGMLDAIYSMADVRRDLDIPAREPLDPREFDLDKMMEEG
jgi:hypothetical protein